MNDAVYEDEDGDGIDGEEGDAYGGGSGNDHYHGGGGIQFAQDDAGGGYSNM